MFSDNLRQRLGGRPAQEPQKQQHHIHPHAQKFNTLNNPCLAVAMLHATSIKDPKSFEQLQKHKEKTADVVTKSEAVFQSSFRQAQDEEALITDHALITRSAPLVAAKHHQSHSSTFVRELDPKADFQTISYKTKDGTPHTCSVARHADGYSFQDVTGRNLCIKADNLDALQRQLDWHMQSPDGHLTHFVATPRPVSLQTFSSHHAPEHVAAPALPTPAPTAAPPMQQDRTTQTPSVSLFSMFRNGIRNILTARPDSTSTYNMDPFH